MRKWFILSLSIFFFFGCDPESKTKSEICNDNIDNDGDTFVDCADPGCFGQAGGPTGQLCQSQESRCDDEFDNDADGNVDCADSDCAASCGAVEDCDNTTDDDGDGDIDCDDADCVADPACTGGEICDNTTDDDGDGDIDCDDADCVADPACTGAEICNNTTDDDGDGDIDCEDVDCLGQQGAGGLCQATETACDDEFDNDADGDVDCTDDDCAGDAACQGPVEICATVGDEDGDSLPDCQDPECNNQTGPGGGTCQTTETSCADSYDNDGDGDSDCADSDCAAECITAGSLVITEIMKDPNVVADTEGEWFEVTNTSVATIDLGGLVIFSSSSGGEETHVITGSVPVAAGARIVLGISGNFGLNGGVTVGYVFTGITFNNTSDDLVGIRTAGGTVIDQVAFPAATFPGFAGWAMQLDSAHTTAADNDTAAYWCPSRVKYNSFDMGTPGVANHTCALESACNDSNDNDGDGTVDCADFGCAHAANCSTAAAPVAGSLIISEIMANPGVGTPSYQYEWFEISNPTAGPVELNGLTICDDTPTRYCFLAHFGVSTPLAAGGKAIFVSDNTVWSGFSGTLFAYGPAIQLGNAADAVQVYSGVTLIDAVVFDAAWPFATAGRAVQFSTSATQDNTANDSVANWCVAINEYDAVNHLLGTPGAANRDCNVSETICNNNLDDDGDGQIDCADTNCLGQTGSLGEVCQATETTCDDGFDNDRDSLTDCADPNCAGLMGPGGIACPVLNTVDLTGYYVEVYQNGVLKQTYTLNGTYQKGKYIVVARQAVDVAAWAASFTPALTAVETQNVVELFDTNNSWQMNDTGDDSAILYNPSTVEIDRAANPANKIRTRQADGSWVDGTTTDGAQNAPDAITGYTHPVYCFQIAEAASTIELTAYQGNYVMLYIPNN
ncbi:lamin tail domain-containing protein [Myxococcota bacterium]|nr:lamin tail domain-containing protein [Myxococcota bacterium]MBU1510455.1 lamin tail domain-containing protein [Myxococcota bacterium]